MSETRISPLGLFQFSPTKRRHLSRFKNYIFDPRVDTLSFALLDRRREKQREGGKFSPTPWISSAIRGSRSAVSRNEVTRPEPSLSVSRFPAGSSICRYLARRVIRAETSVYARRRRCAVSRAPHLRSAVCRSGPRVRTKLRNSRYVSFHGEQQLGCCRVVP